MCLIKIENLVKKYDKSIVVKSVNLDIKKGEIFGLLGPNGAGKTTTISMLSGLLKPNSGRILVDGHDVVKDSMSAKKIIGLVPQDIALYTALTAEENLYFFGRMYDLSGKLLRKRVSEVLEIAGLEDRKKEKIKNYSGGMKRRINIAAAILHKPEILIMDEPTVGIDPQSRNHILESVKEFNKRGMTIIYTSHYMEEVEYLCSRIGIMDNGKIIALGDKEELKNNVSGGSRIEIEVSSVVPGICEKIKKVNGVKQVHTVGTKIIINSDKSRNLMPKIMNAISEVDADVLSVNINIPNLESVFLNLTGRALRD